MPGKNTPVIDAATGGGRWEPWIAGQTEPATIVLPVATASARLAREFVRSVLGPPDDYTAALVTSELVTNALRHTRTEPHLSIAFDDRFVRIEVQDDGEGVPVPAPMDAVGTSGRGLALVAAVAGHWGVIEQSQSKIVWATVIRHQMYGRDAVSGSF
jgi:hypothetical protein